MHRGNQGRIEPDTSHILGRSPAENSNHACRKDSDSPGSIWLSEGSAVLRGGF